VTIWVTTNGRPSNGAKALASQPGFKRSITGKGVQPGEKIINWGSTSILSNVQMINKPDMVALAANKLKAFYRMEIDDISLPAWTDDQEAAQDWSDADCVVVCRTKLTGHSGDGIIIVEKGDQVPVAPLYTKYIFKEKEFRVHVVAGAVVDTQRKIRDPEREPTDWKVRSYDNGFIYVRNGIPGDVLRDTLACSATEALELDFGAVDIIQDKKDNYYVLEINTAPGLEGQTVERYAEAFRASYA
jgi:hypothetical protein